MSTTTKFVGFHRGKPRIYFQSTQLAQFGFAPGARYDVIYHPGEVELLAWPEGKRAVCKKVVGATTFSIIDLNAGLDIFKDVKVVSVIHQPQRIVIRPEVTA